MNTVLLFGGPSEERLVSFASAQNMAQVLERCAFWFWSKNGGVYVLSGEEVSSHARPFEVEYVPSMPPRWESLEAALDDQETYVQNPVFFLGFHGTMGEDGVVQTYLEKRGYAFTGSSARASQNAFDKGKAKEIVSAAGIRVPRASHAESGDPEAFRKTIEEAFNRFGAIVIKPMRSGSSDGLNFVSQASDIDGVVERLLARPLETYLIEERIVGREFTCGVLETPTSLIPLPASEVRVVKDGAFDYAGKYLGKGTEEITPAELPPDEMQKVQKIAMQAHEALGCRGYSRTDILLDEKGYVFLETNTLPGLSKASFIPQQLASAGIPLKDFVAYQLLAAGKK